MEIKDDIKNGAKLVISAATDAAQAVVEKSRLRAQAIRIKQLIKNERELQNQAYIELGRYYYENMRDKSDEEREDLCTVIDTTTDRIEKASVKFVEVMNQYNDTKLSSENSAKIKMAVAQKASDIKDSTTEKVTGLKDKAKEISTDTAAKAKEFTAEKAQQAKQTVLDIKDELRSRVFSQDELDDMIEEHEAIIAELEAVKAEAQTDDAPTDAEADAQNIPTEDDTQADADTDNDEEAPDDFAF